MSVAVGQWVERNNKRFVVSEIGAGVAVLRCGFDTLREQIAEADAGNPADDSPQTDAGNPADVPPQTDADAEADAGNPAGVPPQAIAFSVDASALAKRLQPLARLVKRCRKSILRNVAVVVENSSVELHATDAEEYRIENVADVVLSDVSGAGVFLVDVAALIAALKICKTQTFLRWESGELSATVGKRQLTVDASDDWQEFPDWNGCPTEAETTIARLETDAGTFARIVNQTATAVDASENSRFALSGILLNVGQPNESGNVGFSAIGTDGKRLHFARSGLSLNESAECKTRAILHGAHCRDVLQALKNGAFVCVELLQRTRPTEENSTQENANNTKPPIVSDADALHVGVFNASGESVALFRFRLVDGRFPSWQDVLRGPYNGARVADVDADELATVLQEFKTAKCNARTGFAVADCVLSLNASADVGKTENALSISQRLDVCNGGTIETCLDWRFCLDVATVAGGNVLRVRADNENSPVLFSCADFDAVVMPLAIEKKQTDADESADDSPEAGAN